MKWNYTQYDNTSYIQRATLNDRQMIINQINHTHTSYYVVQYELCI